MAFSEDPSAWGAFLAEWPLERLRTIVLDEYTRAGDRYCSTEGIRDRFRPEADTAVPRAQLPGNTTAAQIRFPY